MLTPAVESDVAKEDEFGEFDDILPGVLPIEAHEPLIWNVSKNPDWVNYALFPSSQRPAGNPILHPTPWLRTLCIPVSHHANCLVKRIDLVQIHHALYYHAAAMRHKELGSRNSNVFMKPLPSKGPSPNTALKFKEGQAL